VKINFATKALRHKGKIINIICAIRAICAICEKNNCEAIKSVFICIISIISVKINFATKALKQKRKNYQYYLCYLFYLCEKIAKQLNPYSSALSASSALKLILPQKL
jgi:dipeptide/tripeptide permease